MDSILKGHAGKWIRRCVLFILDLCLIYLSLRVAILMRYENHVSAGTLKNIYSAVPQLLLVFGACSIVGRHGSVSGLRRGGHVAGDLHGPQLHL